MKTWQIFLQDLEKKFGKASIDKWLRPLKVEQFDACNLFLKANDAFQIHWFEQHVRKLAEDAFVNNNGHPIKIHFVDLPKKKLRQQKPAATPQVLDIHTDPIDTTYTFTNFVNNEKNAFVTQFFKKIIPGTYNPIFLYGPAGVGKTHLITACANLFKKQGLRVFYVHAETFTEHVVKAIRSFQMREFRKIYRNTDILILDDIHHIANRSATQEEFFHTFNTLHTSGKQIILTSHLPPGQIQDIEPRLISRFEWGILLKLEPLQEQEMGQVLQNKTELHHFPLNKEQTNFLIKNFNTNPKNCIRALEALILRSPKEEKVSLDQMKDLLADLIQEESKEKITPEKIISSTAVYFGVPPDDIVGKSQAKEAAFPRKLAMFMCRYQLKMPYLSIGKIFNRDHSTVMTSIRQIESKKKDGDIKEALEEISKCLLKK